jgi:hypothetical protein
MIKHFTVKYGRQGGGRYNRNFTHSHVAGFVDARERCDSFLAGEGNGGWPLDELRVWVENARGEIVYGSRPGPTQTYRVAPTFFADHVLRDLPEAGRQAVLRETRSYVEVELDGDAYDDLLSDARYYSDPGIARDMGLPGLAVSARAVARRLEQDGRPEEVA